MSIELMTRRKKLKLVKTDHDSIIRFGFSSVPHVHVHLSTSVHELIPCTCTNIKWYICTCTNMK